MLLQLQTLFILVFIKIWGGKDMKKTNKKIIAVFIVILLIIVVVLTAVTFGINYFKEEKVNKEPLNVKVFANKVEGTAPLLLNFSSIVTNSEGEIKYLWDLGNGNTSEEREPSTIYETNGTYICTLTVTDKRGQKASDRINIFSKNNDPPSVSIILNSKNPSRPYLPGTIKIWAKYADNFNGRKLRVLVKFLPNSSNLMNMEGFVSCKAIAVDPEGDEIVSYKWILEPYPYTLRGTQVKPQYVFETKENEFTFPLLYTFGPSETKFDVTVIVTDSNGNTNYATDQFNVQKSSPETTAGIINLMTTGFRNFIWNIIIAPSLSKDMKESFADMLWSFAEKSQLPIIEAYLKIKIFIFLLGWNLLSLNDPSLIILRFADSFTSLIEKYPTLLEPAAKVLDFSEDLIVNLNVSFISVLALPIIQDVRELWGISNYIPDISDPNPEKGDKVYNPNYPAVSVRVYDLDAKPSDWFNVTIYGKYVKNETWNYTNEGIFSANLSNPLPANEKISWYVEVQDHLGRIAKEEYWFLV